MLSLFCSLHDVWCERARPVTAGGRQADHPQGPVKTSRHNGEAPAAVGPDQQTNRSSLAPNSCGSRVRSTGAAGVARLRKSQDCRTDASAAWRSVNTEKLANRHIEASTPAAKRSSLPKSMRQPSAFFSSLPAQPLLFNLRHPSNVTNTFRRVTLSFLSPMGPFNNTLYTRRSRSNERKSCYRDSRADLSTRVGDWELVACHEGRK